MITTSPPSSMHLVGAAVQRATGARWVADLRDSLVAHPHRRADTRRRAGEGEGRRTASRSSSPAGPTRSPASRRRSRTRSRALEPRGPRPRRSRTAATSTTSPGSSTRPASASGSRTPAASSASATRARSCRRSHDSGPRRRVARFLGDFRAADREWAERSSLGDRLELIPYAPRADVARAAARLGGAAAPDPRGRRPRQGRPLREGVRVPRGRAADPRRRAAGRRGGRPDPRDRRGRRRAARRRRRDRARRSSSSRRGSRNGGLPDGRARRTRRATGSRGAPASRSSPSSCGRCEPASQPEPAHVDAPLLRDGLHGHVREAAVGGRGHAQPLRRPHRRSSSSPSRGGRLARRRPALRLRAPRSRPRFFARLPRSSTWSASSTSTPSRRSRSGRRGWSSSCSTSCFLVAGIALPRAARRALLLADARASSCGGIAANALYGSLQLGVAPRSPAINLDQSCSSPITGGASQINVYGAIEGSERLPAERAHGRPEPPRDRAARAAARPDRRSTCGSSAATGCGCRSRSLLAFLLLVELATLSRSGLLGLAVGAARARGPVPAPALDARGSSLPLGGVAS